jgi:hypothetical protein
MTHQIEVPQLVRAEVQPRRGERTMERRLMYVPPIDGSLDPHRGFDAWVASQIMAILDGEHPGYPWFAASNAEQGIVYFSIPVLMGETLRHLIKLGDWSDLSPVLVKRGAGELLERLGLPKAFDEASFMHAKNNKHLFDFAGVGARRR